MRALPLLLILACSTTEPSPPDPPPCETDCNDDTASEDTASPNSMEPPQDSGGFQADTDQGSLGDTASSHGTRDTQDDGVPISEPPEDSAQDEETITADTDTGSSHTGNAYDTDDDVGPPDTDTASSHTGTTDSSQFGEPTSSHSGDTYTPPPPPPEPLEACNGETYVPTTLGNGSCDAEWNCPDLGYDAGDCLAGRTSWGAMTVRNAGEAALLDQEVDSIRGTLHIVDDGTSALTDLVLRTGSWELMVDDNGWLRSLDLRGFPSNVTIRDASALQSVALSNSFMYGRFTVENCPTLTHIDMPALWSLEAADVRGVPQLATWTAPLLQSSDGIWLRDTALPAWPFPGLVTASHGIGLENNPQMLTADLPTTGDMTGPVLVRNNPNLTRFAMNSVGQAESVLLRDLPALTDLSLNSLNRVSGSVHIEQTNLPAVSLPALANVGTGLWLSDGDALTQVDLPQLHTAGRIELSRLAVSDVDLPLLARAGEVRIRLNDDLVDLEFPLLDHADSLHIEACDSLESVEMPTLTDLSDGSLFLGYNDALDHVHAPLLEHAVDIDLRWNNLQTLSLPSLDTVDARVHIAETPLLDLDLPALSWLSTLELRGLDLALVELPALTSMATGNLRDLPADRVSFPLLHTIHDRLVLSDAETVELSLPSLVDTEGWLNLVDLPLLQSLETTPQHLGRLGLVRTGLTDLSMPSLTMLDDHLALYDNAALAQISLPHLVSALEVSLEDHPALEGLALDNLGATESVRLVGLAALQTAAFPELRTVERRLLVQDNVQLFEVGVPLLDTLGRLELSGNPLLGTCDLVEQATSLGAWVVTDEVCPVTP